MINDIVDLWQSQGRSKLAWIGLSFDSFGYGAGVVNLTKSMGEANIADKVEGDPVSQIVRQFTPAARSNVDCTSYLVSGAFLAASARFDTKLRVTVFALCAAATIEAYGKAMEWW